MNKSLLFLFLFFFSSIALGEQAQNPYAQYRIETYQIQADYLQNYANHHEKLTADLEAKLEQQRWQTTAIAIMVFIMVGLGLFLSYLQFKRDGEDGRKSSFSLKMGTGSIEISSSVIGLAILALSFYFFQTYIEEVYNIQVFNVQPVDLTTFGVNH